MMSRGGLGRVTGVLAMLVVIVGCWATRAAVAQAAMPSTFGEHGEGAGQMRESHGIAVDRESGDVYVVDSFNARVDEFGGAGEFIRSWGWGVLNGEDKLQVCTGVTGCLTGHAGAGVGQFGRPQGTAVASSSGLPRGDVYVVDTTNARVEKFDPEGRFVLMFGGEVNATKDARPTATAAEKDVCTQREIELEEIKCAQGVAGEANGEFANAGNTIGVDAEGRVFVGDGSGRVQRFSEDGEYEATVVQGIGAVEGLAVASDGDLYVLSSGRPGVREYEPSGAEVGLGRDASGDPRSLAASLEGGVFVDDQNFERGGEHHFFEYDTTGTQTESFDKAAFTEDASRGFAFNEETGLLYLLNHFTENSGRVEVDDVRTVAAPPPGPVVVPPVSVTPLPHHKAIIKAVINPENAKTEYFVRYGVGVPLTNTSAVGEMAATFEEAKVVVELSGLTFSTEYHYCLVARNADGETPCVEETFVAAPATAVDAEWVQDVTSGSVTLAAEVNPEETATECVFDYGTVATYASTGSFEREVATSGIVAPANADVVVSAHVQEGVAPGTEYVYRLLCEKESVIDEGRVQHFSSASGHVQAVLADRRTLELVATDVNGAALAPPEEAGLPQGSEAGDAVVYLRRAPSSKNAAGNRAIEPTVDIARHQESNGWSSVDITTPYGSAAPVVSRGTEYLLFSDDLSSAVVAPRDATPLSAGATERTPYRRTEPAGEAFYQPLLTSADVAEGVKFGEERVVEVEGADLALTHVVLASRVPLLGESAAGALYEWSAGHLTPVSVLPTDEGGEVVEGNLGGPHAGGHTGNARGAISADGSLVYWRHGVGLYVRDTQTGESLRLDVPQEGVVPRSGEVEGSEFQIASADGSRVFFTATRRLAGGASANGEAPDLYECTITAPPAGRLSCALSDVTEKLLHAGEHANVQGLVAATDEAGGRVFFVAKGALAEGATAGEFNLYTAVKIGGGWQIAWIATLASTDGQDWAESGTVLGLHQMTERSSSDGHWFTFMSSRSLTGYDNRDAASGVPDEEVYLYDTQNDRLVCVSCDPTGSRPHGFFDEHALQTATSTIIDIEGIWRDHWVAALLPGWQSLSGVGEYITAYQPRSLSDSGRLFFESATALTSQAANGTVGVYEFEPAGVGSCTTSTIGYSPVIDGCATLISPGTAAGDSAFIDASVNGNDAFVMSRAGGSGVEGSGPAPYSILDAHSCEAESGWACAAPVPATPTRCESARGCKLHMSAAPAGVGLPASSVVSRVGNAIRKAVKSGKRRGVGSCRAKARQIAARKRRRRALARCEARRARGRDRRRTGR